MHLMMCQILKQLAEIIIINQHICCKDLDKSSVVAN